MKRQACDAIEERKAEVIDIAKDILRNPETGFKEQRDCATGVGEI